MTTQPQHSNNIDIKTDEFEINISIKNGMVQVSIFETSEPEFLTLLQRYKGDKGDIRISNDGIIKTDSTIEEICFG